MASSNALADITAGAAGSGVPAGDAGAAERTEEDILGIASEDGSEVSEYGKEAAAARQAEGAEPQPEGEEPAGKQPGTEELNPDEVSATVPAELKHLLSDAKVAPHIQRAFDQLAAYSSLGTVRDARAFAEEFPGGVKEAQEYKSRALDVADWDAQYESGDPTQQADLALSWFQHAAAAGRPEVFRSQVASSLDVLKKHDPEGFKQLTGGNVQETFGGDLVGSDGRSWNLSAQYDAILDAIKRDDADALKGYSYFLVRELSQMGVGKREGGGARVPKENEAFKQREQELSTRAQQIQQQAQTIFTRTVNTDARAGMERSVNAQLSNLLKDTAFTADGKKDIAAQVITGIQQRLQADRSYQNRVRDLVRAAQWDPEKSGDLVNFIIARSKALTVSVAKDVITKETKKFVAQTKEQNERRTGAGQRVDITGGQASSVRGTKLTQKQISGMTDDQKDAYVNARLGI